MRKEIYIFSAMARLGGEAQTLWAQEQQHLAFISQALK